MKDTTIKTLSTVVSDIVRVTSMVQGDTDDVLLNGDTADLIRHYDRMRIVVAQIKEAREALDKLTERVSKEYIPDSMRRIRVKTMTVEGVGRCTVSNRFSCSIIEKAPAYKWLRETGNGGIITETVNSSTLSAFAKEMLEEAGKELPPDLFKVSTQSYTSITKA